MRGKTFVPNKKGHMNGGCHMNCNHHNNTDNSVEV